MANLKPFQPVLPFVGILFRKSPQLETALEQIEKYLWPLNSFSPKIDFNYTRYYDREMGSGIIRMWAGSHRLADPSNLTEWKLATDKIEREMMEHGNRVVNLDPGFVALSKAVLASLKDFPQRIPLKNGVLAEIELTFMHNRWYDTPWTYGDYSDKPAKEFLYDLREILLWKLKSEGKL